MASALSGGVGMRREQAGVEHPEDGVVAGGAGEKRPGAETRTENPVIPRGFPREPRSTLVSRRSETAPKGRVAPAGTTR